MIHGDCIEVMQELPRKSVDLVITGPPCIANYRSRDRKRSSNEDNLWLDGPLLDRSEC